MYLSTDMGVVSEPVPFMADDEIPLIRNNDSAIFDMSIDEEEAKKEGSLKKHTITLWFSDALVLVLEHLQYYALLLSLSERWGWPMDWINATSFTFLANFDIWEFRKVQTGLFNHSRASFIDSRKLGFNYVSYLASWAVVVFVIGAGFSAIYLRWMQRRPLYLLLYVAYWKRVLFMVTQLLCVPFGIAASRVFHCRLEPTRNVEVMDVQNEFDCYSGPHVAFMVLVLVIFLGIFFIFPLILGLWISEQVFSKDPARHEGYVQLKEAEYEQGLDSVWDTGQYHLFASFARAWVFYNPLKFLFKLLLLGAFALSVKATFWSSAAICAGFFVAVLALLIRRPFRVRSFNVSIIFSHLCLAGNAIIGNFMVTPPWEDPKTFVIVAFLRFPAVLYILIFVNAAWLLAVTLWAAYLGLTHLGFVNKGYLWPRLSYENSNLVGEDTKKYLKAALQARQTLEHALAAIPLFAPVHELSHQVRVINAYCREAEFIQDPTHDTLWDLLDELIEAHNALSKTSVFGMSGKNSVRETSEEFIKLMPSFRKRLAQREYDLILVPPLKRRLLLKMYILGIFMNAKKHRRAVAKQAVDKLNDAWRVFDTASLSELVASDSSGSVLSVGETPLASRATTRPTSNATGLSLEKHKRSPTDSVSNLINQADSIGAAQPGVVDKGASAQGDHALMDTAAPSSSSSPSGLGNPSDERRASSAKRLQMINMHAGVVSARHRSPKRSLPMSPLAREALPREALQTSARASASAAIPPSSKQVYVRDPGAQRAQSARGSNRLSNSDVSMDVVVSAAVLGHVNQKDGLRYADVGYVPSRSTSLASIGRRPVAGLDLVMTELPSSNRSRSPVLSRSPSRSQGDRSYQFDDGIVPGIASTPDSLLDSNAGTQSLPPIVNDIAMHDEDGLSFLPGRVIGAVIPVEVDTTLSRNSVVS